jgi:amidophosphoribosyltransferase
MVTTSPFDDDKLREECGVFGIHGDVDAAPHTVLGLHALQHRGQEAAGLVSFDGEQFHAHRDLGLVGDIFSKPEVIGRLPGHAATRCCATSSRCSPTFTSAASRSATTAT